MNNVVYIYYVRNFIKKTKSFTLQETMVVLALIGFLVIYTATTTLNVTGIKEKKIATVSQTFYSNVAAIYNDILLNETSGYSLENLNGATGNTKNDNKLILEKFANYLNGDLTFYKGESEGSCKELVIQDDYFKSYVDNNMYCGFFPGDIIAAFSYNYGCNGVSSEEIEEEDASLQNIIIQEYREKKGVEINSHEVTNTCGYIIYGFKYGRGIFGQDLFTIALGKRQVK